MTFRSRATVTLDGSTGAGKVGAANAFTVFLVTGTVFIKNVFATLRTGLPNTGGVIDTKYPLGLFLSGQTTDDLNTDTIWTWVNVYSNLAPIDTTLNQNVVWTSEGSAGGTADMTLEIVGGTDVTSGVIDIDVWWEPMTALGNLYLNKRNKYVQPFPATSIWNQPLRDSAVYVAASIPAAIGASPGYINVDEDILQLDATGQSTVPHPYSGDP